LLNIVNIWKRVRHCGLFQKIYYIMWWHSREW